MKSLFSRFLSLMLCFQVMTVQNFALAENASSAPVVIESDAAGFNEQEQSYSRANSINYGELSSMLTNLAATGDGSIMLTLCNASLTYDHLAHSAGAVAYIAMAIASKQQMKTANETIVQDTISLSGISTTGVEGTDALSALKSVEEERKKALRTKSIGLYAFTAALIVAEVLAIIGAVKENSNLYTVAWAKAEILGQKVCSGAVASTVNALVMPLLNSLITGADPQSTDSEKKDYTLLMTIISGILPLVTTASTKIRTSLEDNYVSKAIYHGVVLGIVGTSTVINEVKISKNKKNIIDIEKMSTDYSDQVASANNSISNDDETIGDSGGPIPGNDTNRLDPQRDLHSRIASDPSFKNLQTSIKPASIGPAAYKGIDSPTLVASIGALNQIPRDIAGGNIAGVEASAQTLSRNIGKLKKIRNAMRDKLNKTLVKSGKKPIDFAARSNKIAKQIQDKTRAQLASAFGNDPAAKSELAKKKTVTPAQVKTVSASSEGNTIDLANNSKAKSEEFLDDDLFDEELEAVGKLNNEDSLDNYELAKNDIHRGSTRSIFKVLSVRYLKTAYPKLLEETK